jgi:hypothetical protein
MLAKEDLKQIYPPPPGATASSGPGPPHYRGFKITLISAHHTRQDSSGRVISHDAETSTWQPVFPLSCVGARPRSDWNTRAHTELLLRSWNFLIMHNTKDFKRGAHSSGRVNMFSSEQ